MHVYAHVCVCLREIPHMVQELRAVTHFLPEARSLNKGGRLSHYLKYFQKSSVKSCKHHIIHIRLSLIKYPLVNKNGCIIYLTEIKL